MSLLGHMSRWTEHSSSSAVSVVHEQALKGYGDTRGNVLGPCTVDGLSRWVLVTPHCHLHPWQHLVHVR